MANTEPRLLGLLPTEFQLLFESVRPARVSRTSALTPEQWKRLCYPVEREKAAISVWQHVSRNLDETARAQAQPIRNLATVMEFRMHYLQSRLTQTVAALHAAGIRCLLLKGAALASTLYASFTERPMLDLDLLVKPQDARRAYELLQTIGWAVPAAERSVVLRQGGIHHLPALHDASGMAVNVEVHTELIPPGHPFGFSAEDVWAEARPLEGPLAGAFVPSPEHLALHSCIHLAWSHMLRTGTWRTCRDLERITQVPGFDWERLVRLAHKVGASSCCYWTLRLAAGLAGLDVPPASLAAFRRAGGNDRAVDGIVSAVLERHLLAVLIPGGPDCPSVRLRRLAWVLAIRPESNGHGRSRPWLSDDDHMAQESTPKPAGLSFRAELGKFTAGAADFRRYAEQVLRPARVSNR